MGKTAGDRLAHYRILGKLGAGGMGEVYRARDEQLDRDVAIKVLPPASLDNRTAHARLVREARSAASLNHPHICTVHEVGEANGETYIAMELVEGETLRARLDAGPLPLDLVFKYGLQLADALGHAHERGIVHRDFKSANIIVSPEGRAKILDFGLAKRLSPTEMSSAVTESQPALTQPGAVMGTLGYMAPEQLRGQLADAASDVWAMGIVLHEMASGAAPFKGRTGYELSAAILNEGSASLSPDVPASLQAIIGRCLEKQPAARYEDANAVRTALEQVHLGASPPPIPTRVPRASRRLALWVAAAALVGAAAAATIWYTSAIPEPSRSLAVLPLVNTASDEDIDYLCGGITESLIRQVSTLRSLKVMPRSAVFNFSGQDVGPRDAGQRLGVDVVLAGTLTRQAQRLLITMELIDVASGARLWQNKFNREAADLLAVQDEIATAIMDDGLRIELSSDQRRQLVTNPTNDGEAYDLFLQARHIQRRATEEDYLYSRQLLRRAIVRDPNFALAYVSIGGTYAMMAADGLERPTDAWPQSNRHTRKALELMPDLREAHVLVHAQAFLFDWDWAGAEKARKTVLAGLTSDVDPQMFRALAMERWALGRPDEALELARRSRELDPLSPNLSMMEADYLVHAGQLDSAAGLYEKSIAVDPLDPNPYFGLADVRYRQRRFDEAVEVRRRAHTLAGDDQLNEALASARGERGYRELDRIWVRAQLEALKTRAVTNYVSPLDFARTYAQLDDKEQAFRYLEAAFIDRSPGLVYLKVDKAWDSVRADPRFQEAVTRVGLP